MAALTLEDYTEAEVELVNFEAQNSGTGAGSLAMEKLVAAADDLGINLMLIRCAANPAVQGRVKSADGKAVLVVWIGFNAAFAAARCTGE